MTAPHIRVLFQLGGILENAGEYAGTLPEPVSAPGALFYGAWAVFGYGVVKKGAGLLRSSETTQASATIESGTAADKTTTTVGTTSETGPSLAEEDAPAFTLPGFVPLSKGVRQVTHNEIHAMELGVVLGFAVSWLVSLGEQTTAVFIATLFIVGALGYKRYRTKAFETARLEPWYAVVAFAIGAGAGWLFFAPDVALFEGISLPL
ncbi:MAG: hypothetical protein V5A25_11070 [Halovenus sp.]